MSRFIDLSIPLDNDIPAGPPFQPVEIEYTAQLPSTGFTVVCFPVKITKASAGWARCVAVLPD